MRRLKKIVSSILPKALLETSLGAYHFVLAYIGALMYRFPSRELLVVAVTGTKGKTSVSEMVNAILEEAGYKTALVNSIRFKIGEHSERNLTRMSMPGRFFIQRLMRQAVSAGCIATVLEMTSEGARQNRHRAITLNALIFTNLAPEHIESHGSYEKYADAKFKIGQALARSNKRPRIIVANADDVQSARYLALPVEKSIGFSLHHHQHTASEKGGQFTFNEKLISIRFPGEFSLMNALAAASLAHELGIETATIKHALEKMQKIPGRAERIEAGQDFVVVVDYAHTPESLRALYEAYGHARKIAVLGNTGGGRDTWKRPVMGGIADEYCDEVILTNEDPYDEDPRAILDAMARGCKSEPTIIMDRREAIRRAISKASAGDAVLITGKGTDPSICVENGKKIPWSDADVAREELGRLLKRV